MTNRTAGTTRRGRCAALLLTAGLGVGACTADPADPGAPGDATAAGPRFGTFAEYGPRTDLQRVGVIEEDDAGCLRFVERHPGTAEPVVHALVLPEGARVTDEGGLQIPTLRPGTVAGTTVEGTASVEIGEEVGGAAAELSLRQARAGERGVSLPEGCYPDGSGEAFLFEPSTEP
ncbi:hypothetical protein [Micrococcus endophyticus]|uniref:hypothetical protein n=1 Tax=Micrococcus endophyticus TaxID=455343 RepID=UPI0034CEF3F3